MFTLYNFSSNIREECEQIWTKSVDNDTLILNSSIPTCLFHNKRKEQYESSLQCKLYIQRYKEIFSLLCNFLQSQFTRKHWWCTCIYCWYVGSYKCRKNYAFLSIYNIRIYMRLWYQFRYNFLSFSYLPILKLLLTFKLEVQMFAVLYKSTDVELLIRKRDLPTNFFSFKPMYSYLWSF